MANPDLPTSDDSQGWVSGPCGPPVSWGLIIDVFNVLEEHGFRKSADDQHTGRAVHMVMDLARVYSGQPGAPSTFPDGPS